MKRFLSASILSITLIGLGGCSSYRTEAVLPEPSPLAAGYPAVHSEQVSETERSPDLPAHDPDSVLTLDMALSLALKNNPELMAFSLEVRAREARSLQASLAPNPELSIEVENFGGSGALNGFDGSETTISLGQLIELGGKRGKRNRVAALESDLAGWDYEARRLDLFTEVVKAFTVVLILKEREKLNEELLDLSQRIVTSIDSRVRAGKVSPAEISRAKVQVLTRQIELERVRRELNAARQRLAATWGSDSPRFGKVAGRLDTMTSLPSMEKLKMLIEQNPDMARWPVEMTRRQADLDLQKTGKIPDLTIIGGFRRLNDINDNAFVAGLSIPITIFDRNQGGIEEALIRQRLAEKQRQTAEMVAYRRLAETYGNLSAAHNEISTLNDNMLDEAQNAFKEISQGYMQGKFGFLDLLDAQRTLYQTRARYLSALLDYHRSVADIERLIGQRLDRVE